MVDWKAPVIAVSAYWAAIAIAINITAIVTVLLALCFRFILALLPAKQEVSLIFLIVNVLTLFEKYG
jgi:hypothetical protein